MEKLATVFAIEGKVYRLDVIEFADALWLVGKWMTHKSKPLKRPERLIRLTGLQFELSPDPSKTGADYLVNEPIPMAIIEGIAPVGMCGKFVILDKPNLTFPIANPH